jgi:hypothetical protein
MRKAFSMITAIFLIVIMSTVAILVFNLSGKITKSTSIQFRTEQAALLARSYTELAVMSVIDYDRSSNTDCVEEIKGVVNSIIPGQSPSSNATSKNGGGYDVRTYIYYIGDSLPCKEKYKLIDSTRYSSTKLSDVTTYQASSSMSDAVAAVIIDVYVRYKDPNADSPKDSPWITYHRRTIQKI